MVPTDIVHSIHSLYWITVGGRRCETEFLCIEHRSSLYELATMDMHRETNKSLRKADDSRLVLVRASSSPSAGGKLRDLPLHGAVG